MQLELSQLKANIIALEQANRQAASTPPGNYDDLDRAIKALDQDYDKLYRT